MTETAVKKAKENAPMLRGILTEVDDKEVINLGSSTSYLFIGTKEKLLADKWIIDSYMAIGYLCKPDGEYIPLMQRKVCDTRYREDGTLAIIIEGQDEGKCWFAHEYPAARESMMQIVARCVHALALAKGRGEVIVSRDVQRPAEGRKN